MDGRCDKILKYIVRCMIVCAILVMCIQSEAATGSGIVNTDGLNVRTGAGTGYDILQRDGDYVRLTKNTKVNIKEVLDSGWYKVSVSYYGDTVEGYVAAQYVDTDSDVNDSNSTSVSVRDKNMLADNISVASTMISKQRVCKKAAKKSAYLKYNKKNMYVKKGAKVKITGVYKVSKERWYKIMFTYKKMKCTGYINSAYVKLTSGKNVKSYITGKTSVYTRTARTAYAKVKKKKVKLKINKKVNVIAEKKSGNVKWFKIRYTYSGKTRTGWVPAEYVMFISGKNKKNTVTKPKTTSRPTATPTSRPLVALSDAEFEAVMTEQGFPDSYKNSLRLLHQKYPYWQFNGVKTGIDFNSAVDKESVPGKSLVPNSKTTSWKSTASGAYNWETDSYVIFDGTTWVAASREGVAYYMDPRNFLDEKYVFMFEALTYEADYQKPEGVATIFAGTPFEGASFTYVDELGVAQTKTYQDVIMEAASLNGVSPYHLASRIRQEVVTGPVSVSNSVTGTVPGYEGIYNFYNIGASDSSGGGAVQNGLKYASSGTTYMRPWNNQYRSLVGGAQYIANNYISRGQNTLYLERFNVTSKSTYDHQYMTNVSAAYSEAGKVYTAYKDWMANVPILFYIPIYENMPKTACESPKGNLNPNNYLKSISVTGSAGEQYSFTPAFDVSHGGSVMYTINVPVTETSVTISATAVSDKAVITGTGQITLVNQTMPVNIQVTAEDGNIRNYTITINRI